MNRLVASALIATTLVASTVAARPRSSETERNRAIVSAFAEQFYGRRDVAGAFEKFVVADYIQHNPGIPDGRAAAIAALAQKFATPGARFDVKRIIVDGDLAVIHLHGRTDPASPGGAVADIYRLKDGKIVEHWDVIQPMPTTARNPHPMF
ncbi:MULTISPECIES: nuclear transport factor 2 family protein [Sphingomonas]|jgi:predicted SnoaL-like aldol condensation-catalyzing enzyme|uniref:Polyketide cyclase n=1 Tax=Sphingomonas hankookensis TaxID=563996 RepID=A0ABR5YBZ9_9SPHN|nr:MULTISPECIES: nuclear transport factor 2 family protein [Sphingomonas]KZE11840.1 polyketide cyclase [Sphingomonas hankookensis]PZT93262.1 MAG: polyketide cyclase [Sphingomonas sp.]WCP70882.1 nuclear transport factor 2 family protein [Sphingomonas hankookensis]